MIDFKPRLKQSVYQEFLQRIVNLHLDRLAIASSLFPFAYELYCREDEREFARDWNRAVASAPKVQVDGRM